MFNISDQTLRFKKLLQPIDRVALAVMLVLSLLIGILLLSGDHSRPRVRNFSWDNKQVGAQDTAFILTFNRPMNHASVEENLQISPPVPGKFSWAGRRMAYTPLSPVPYGNQYEVQLDGAKDQFSQGSNGISIESFEASFRTRDRAFAYVGVEGEERGRLILYNLTQSQKTILTPQDLVVKEFKSYPEGEQILFSASILGSQDQGLLAQQLYTVTTGLSFQSSAEKLVSSKTAGKIKLVLDSEEYNNLKFDLSADGQTIIVQRVNKQNAGDFGIWIIQADGNLRPLQNQPGGEFLIAPDSASVAVAQGQGVAILPLKSSTEPLDFLPKFGRVLSFANDGSAAAMVKFNNDYTRSLFLVTNQGFQQELLRTTGSVISCQFAPAKTHLYCLLTQLIEGEEYREQPFLAAIDLKKTDDNTTSFVKPLVVLPEQRDIQMDLSPDGLALLFDQKVTQAPSAKDSLRTDEGQAIASGLLWLLPLVDTTLSEPPTKLKPEQLLPGFHPQWLP
ncbi:Ig-like domain-containing protein [Lyngbya aestuarii]|uniref:Ig-like domain-containing protein n=1 Tax=Lyngbya aestuarii TaxID=118322 RepID=UPI00403DE839